MQMPYDVNTLRNAQNSHFLMLISYSSNPEPMNVVLRPLHYLPFFPSILLIIRNYSQCFGFGSGDELCDR